MKPIKTALLWHFHQPYYKLDGEFILPWVRLHGVKDYFNLPELFHEFPKIKQTINLVPSLRMQIDEYIEGTCQDKIQRLTKMEPQNLTAQDKNDILRLFFLCNPENMINPYPRYKELFERSRDRDKAAGEFSDADWRDLQVWYNLTWLGAYSRRHSAASRLFEKGRDFSEDEKYTLLEMHRYILSQIKPQMQMLQRLGQLEISATPMYHPILPLLCGTGSAREALPDIELPDKQFRHPEDAEWHIKKALDYFEDNISYRPDGMWPSEGSISNEVLDLMIKSSVKWAASDEEVLKNSIGSRYRHTHKFFPHKYITNNGSLSVLFRDRALSDAIGFVYSRWNPHDAATDFTNKIKHIRSEIINNHGEEALEHAVVPVILDGENCWEYYPENGIQFQRALFDILSNDGTFETVTVSEAAKEEHTKYLEPLENIKAGSWINGNFRIWIGNRQNRTAWSMLARARENLEKAKDRISSENYKKALGELHIAEGSDWFWWYHDDHQAENKYDFDVMFRRHLELAYNLMELTAPDEVNIPVHSAESKDILIPQKELINPDIEGLAVKEDQWAGAGSYDAEKAMSSMHQGGLILKQFRFGSGEDKIFFRIILERALTEGETIIINSQKPNKFSITINRSSCFFNITSEKGFLSAGFATGEVIDIALDKKIVEKLGSSTYKAEISILVKASESDAVYPRQGSLNVEFM